MPGNGKVFHAFVSYSYRDRRWGEWVHRALETYRLPGGLAGKAANYPDEALPKRLYPVFRDRDEFPTADLITPKVEEAIEQSNSLVVVCSPHSAASEWVANEIRLFRERHPGRPVLALIVDGEPPECFPSSLREQQPLAADVRKGGDGKADARLKLVAGILGVGLSDLKDRDLKRQRRRMSQIAALSATVAVVMAILTGLAVKARKEAEAAQSSAEALIGDIVFDLYNQLQPLGRVDLLDQSSLAALDYFERMPGHRVTFETEGYRTALHHHRGDVLWTKGDLEKAIDSFRACVGAFEEMERTYPNQGRSDYNIHLCLMKIGTIETTLNRFEAAKATYEKAGANLKDWDAHAQEENESFQMKSARAEWLDRVGQLHRSMNDLLAAGKAFSEQVELLAELQEAQPQNQEIAAKRVAAQRHVAGIFEAVGDLTEAESHLREGERIQSLLVQAQPAELAQSDISVYVDLADLKVDLARIRQALGDYPEGRRLKEEVVEIRRALTKHDPENEEWQKGLVGGLSQLAPLASVAGERDTAKKLLEEAVAIAEPRNQKMPDDFTWQHALVQSKLALARVYRSEDDLNRAVDLTQSALRAFSTDAQETSRSAKSLSLQAMAWEQLGSLQRRRGSLAEAHQSLVEARRMLAHLIKSDPGNREWKSDLVGVIRETGRLHEDRGEDEKAEEAFRLAIAELKTMKEEAGGDVSLQADLAFACHDLATLLMGKGEGEPESIMWLIRAERLLSPLKDEGNISPPAHDLLKLIEDALKQAEGRSPEWMVQMRKKVDAEESPDGGLKRSD